jgi:FkbM family methyltransferase
MALVSEDDPKGSNAVDCARATALLPVLSSILAGRRDALELLARASGFQENVVASPRLHAMVTLIQQWQALRPTLCADDSEHGARLSVPLRRIERSEQVRDSLLDLITDGDVIRLSHGSLRFPCRHSLWTLIHEILLNEDYYFVSDSDAPVIIDGGAHMGMAIYYFKARHPHARITAFEPHPEMHALAMENVVRNGWDAVEVLPFALAGSRRESTFHISESWSMAGSLSDRRRSLGDSVREVTVACVPLSGYLNEPVDFLKLDIEGAEDEVLEEAALWLHNVANIFCEFHQGAGVGSGRLVRILAVLERAGFDVQVGKSHNYQERSRRRPFTHFDGAASMVIWARRRRD